MNPSAERKLVLLVILDGYGIAPDGPGNAITHSQTINLNRIWASYPHTQIRASGEAVGLPRGEVGNTETGHLNLGAGRIVYQDLERINMSIADGSFFDNATLKSAINHAKANNSNLHFMGLLGAGGVHSNIEHLFALIHLANLENFKERVYLHLFTDGRDSPPTAAKTYLSRVEEIIQKEATGHIASIMGRYWAMDRDHRWDRTAKAYFALTRGQGNLVKTPSDAVDISYQKGQTDEFIEPSLITNSSGKPIAQVKENDAVIFFNFRIDRPRQLSKSFVLKDFTIANAETDFDPYLVKYTQKHTVAEVNRQPVFDRGEAIKNLFFVTMTEYENIIVEAGAKVAFPPEVVNMPLGRIVSEAGLKQLRASESEKERFVTFYFNGLREGPFPSEERLIIPSPKVATYDLKPEMSARELTEALLNKLRSDNDYRFVLVNYANVDMVGHTGNMAAAIKAIEVVDECVGKLVNFIMATNGVLIITADHGNAEEMINLKTGQIDTEHSSNPVPFIAVSKSFTGGHTQISEGILADIAPTIIKILGLPVPTEMSGKNLLAGIL